MTHTKPHISVVSPVYRAESIINDLVVEIIEALTPITTDFEIILVEDCGPDNSWNKIVENAKKNPCVKGIKLSRNFGQHYAITAGLEAAQGDWIVVMDCDLQDRPDEIPNLYKKALEGYDLVVAQRVNRNDSFLKRSYSKIFYRLFSFLTGTKQDHSIANFGIYHRKVINAVLSMGDAVRAFPMLVQWVGFNSYQLPVVHAERAAGRSSYTLIKLLKLAFDIVISFSQKPLRLAIQLGLLIVLISFVIGIYNLYLYFMGKITVPGYASLIISIWFLSGVIITIIGMMGTYLGKTFEQVKNRPLYIINHKINIDENE